MSKGDERRRWPRIPVRGEIVGQIYTETAAPLLDLSEGGALLEVPCVLRPRAIDGFPRRSCSGNGAWSAPAAGTRIGRVRVTEDAPCIPRPPEPRFLLARSGRP